MVFYAGYAPETVRNLVQLAKEEYYKGISFQRNGIRDFMVRPRGGYIEYWSRANTSLRVTFVVTSLSLSMP